MTMKEMCEAIAAALLADYGIAFPPEAIFNMDPRGELWPVFSMYDVFVRKGMRLPDGTVRSLTEEQLDDLQQRLAVPRRDTT